MTVCESFCKSLKRHEAVVPKTESRKKGRKTRGTLNTSVNTRKLKNVHFTLLTLFPIVSQTYSIKKHLQTSILKKKSAVICASLGVFFTKKFPIVEKIHRMRHTSYDEIPSMIILCQWKRQRPHKFWFSLCFRERRSTMKIYEWLSWGTF